MAFSEARASGAAPFASVPSSGLHVAGSRPTWGDSFLLLQPQSVRGAAANAAARVMFLMASIFRMFFGTCLEVELRDGGKWLVGS